MVAVRRYGLALWVSLNVIQPVFAHEAALKTLSRDVAERLVALDQASTDCAARKREANPAAPQRERLAAFGLSREQTLGAVMYLSLRNDYRCEWRALADLLLASTLLDNARRAYGQPALGYPQALAELTQPNTRYFDLAATYGGLAPAAQTYLEAQYGEEPFDAIAAMDAIPTY